MRDLPRLLDENPRMREDFVGMLASFFERHHIEVTPEDLGEAGDVVGYLFEARSPERSTPRSDQQSPEAT